MEKGEETRDKYEKRQLVRKKGIIGEKIDMDRSKEREINDYLSK